MGTDVGYSKAAERRIAIWKAMNPQPVDPAVSDNSKPAFEVPGKPDKVAETAAAVTPPSTSNQMSAATMDALLSMVSELSNRFTKSEVGVEFAIDYLQEGRKTTETLSKSVLALSNKIDEIADNISNLNLKTDQILALNAPTP
jgi:hypothetical protein